MFSNIFRFSTSVFSRFSTIFWLVAWSVKKQRRRNSFLVGWLDGAMLHTIRSLYTLSLSLSLSHTHSHYLSLSHLLLYLPLTTLTDTHTLNLSTLPLSHTLTCSLSLSLSLSHTHTLIISSTLSLLHTHVVVRSVVGLPSRFRRSNIHFAKHNHSPAFIIKHCSACVSTCVREGVCVCV